MANFLVVVDPDPQHRAEFVRGVRPRLRVFDELVEDGRNCGDCAAMWAASVHAPIDVKCDDSQMCIVWGDAFDPRENLRVTAEQFQDEWRQQPTLPVYDGFHAAIIYDSRRGISVSADPLGIFPVYYSLTADVLLVASSPELFRLHPAVRCEFNPVGLAGILLTNGLVDGQTLFRDVRRLQPGYQLRWSAGSPPRESKQYGVALSTEGFDSPFAAQVDRMGDQLESAVKRHAMYNERMGILLSGGRDSRVLAGFLHDQHDHGIAAYTLGLSSDRDFQCAARLARELHFEQFSAEVPANSYVQCAELCAKWEHLANGFNNVTDWWGYRHLCQRTPRTVMGALGDAVIGGANLDQAYDPSLSAMTFDRLFHNFNRRAVPIEAARKLLRREVFGDAIDQIVESCRTSYASYAERETHRAYCFGLFHQERFHVGSMAWNCAFASWPVLPFADREVIEAVAGMPAASLTQRRAEDALLCRRMSRLAMLPLDRGTEETTPLLMGPRDLATMYWRALTRRLTGKRKRTERRYYYRIWDLNAPGWRAIRREVEPARSVIDDLFQRKEFDALLPHADQPAQYQNTLLDASGPKLMLGFVLWAREHL